MYKQCVEAYDSMQDPIKYYFLDKIQSALEDPETQNVISEGDLFMHSKQKKSFEESDEVFHDIDENVLNTNKRQDSNFT